MFGRDISISQGFLASEQYHQHKQSTALHTEEGGTHTHTHTQVVSSTRLTNKVMLGINTDQLSY